MWTVIASPLRHDLPRIWNSLASRPVAMHCGKIHDGDWRVPVKPILIRFGLTHIMKNNGGVVYFDRSEKASAFFATARSLFEQKPPEITIKHVKGGGYANEPFWAVALALHGMGPLPGIDLHTSTKDATHWSAHVSLRDGTIHKLNKICIFKGGQCHYPIFTHFLSFGQPACPMVLYESLNLIFRGSK